MRKTILTFTGRYINPLDPDPDQIVAADIAHALSNICRYTGHTRDFYSVAQHSVMVAKMVPEEDRLAALLHDASEAYLADVARPVKYQDGFREVYKEAEERLMKAIAAKFGFSYPLPQSVEEADDSILWAEMDALMPRQHYAATDADYQNPIKRAWAPRQAELALLVRLDIEGVPLGH